jgi:hypothetical protein
MTPSVIQSYGNKSSIMSTGGMFVQTLKQCQCLQVYKGATQNSAVFCVNGTAEREEATM